jgi:uncharacterized repeat protein (TIGR02543 family)
MKRTLNEMSIFIIFVLAILVIFFMPLGDKHAVYADAGISISENNFPDENFRSYILDDLDTDYDGMLSKAEINNIKTIDVSNKNISDLYGIEKFTALENLNCSGNPLYFLNIHNTALKSLDCRNDKLFSLDVSEQQALESLDCRGNDIRNLVVKKNHSLISLFCGNNDLKNLDVSENAKLQQLTCFKNNLTSLDVSHNPELKILACDDNDLETLDVSKNNSLKLLYCGGNRLKNLDVSNNPALTYLDCNGNQLVRLDVSRNPALILLKCGGNELTRLNVSDNTALKELYCGNNHLKKLDVKSNTALNTLSCGDNVLSSLDVSHNSSLENLYCYSNQLDTLNVSSNTSLHNLDCSFNDLTSLNMGNITGLKELYCGNNHLIKLNLSKNNNLSDFSAGGQTRTVKPKYSAGSPTINLYKDFGLDYLKVFDKNVTGGTEYDSGIVFKTPLASNAKITYWYLYPKEIYDDGLFVTLNVTDKNIVTFYCKGGSEVSSQLVNSGGKASKPTSDPVKPGYSFEGWYSDWECTKPFDFSQKITKDTTIVAKWSAKPYTVTLDANGGINGTATVTAVFDEDMPTIETIPSRHGYTFDGFYETKTGGRKFYNTDGSSAAEWDQAENATLYAKWKANKFNVKLDANGGTAGTDSVQVVYDSEMPAVSTLPTRTGYSFDGYYDSRSGGTKYYNADGSSAKKCDLMDGTTLFAKWNINKYEVTFINDDGSTVEKQTVEYNNKIAKPNNPKKSGYTFDGWYIDKDCTEAYNFNTQITDDLTLYAKWTINKYDVTFESNGGSTVNKQTVEYNSKAVKPNNPKKSGYTFDGWYTDSKCTKTFDFRTPVIEDTTLYAKWKSAEQNISDAAKNLETTMGDNNPAGSSFGLLQLRNTKAQKTSISLKWTKVKGAKTYVIFANKCGKKYKKFASTKSTSRKVTKVAGRKLKKGTYYKFFVAAFNKNGEKIAVSKTIHVSTAGGKYCNYKSVIVTNVKDRRKVLKKGKSFKLKTSVIKQSNKLKVQDHRKTCFESSDKKIAAVTSSGKIKARRKGVCYIYVYSQSGTFTKVKVTVK